MNEQTKLRLLIDKTTLKLMSFGVAHVYQEELLSHNITEHQLVSMLSTPDIQIEWVGRCLMLRSSSQPSSLTSIHQRTPLGKLMEAYRAMANKTAIDMAQALCTTPAQLMDIETGQSQITLGEAHILMDHAATYFSQSGVMDTLTHLQQAYKESKRHAEKSN